MLISDYKIWDGWLVSDWQRSGRFEAMWRQYSEAGAPQQFWIHRAFAAFPFALLLYKIASCVALFGIASGIFFFATRGRFLGEQSALVASVFVATCPGLMAFGDGALFPYIAGECAFFLAAALAVEAEHRERGLHVAMRVLALFTFFCGLTYYAMVVFYLGFYLLFVRFLARRYEVASFQEWIVLFLKRTDYLLVPPVFWLLKGWFAPTHGYYAGYNTPKLDAANFAEAYGSLFTKYLPGHFAELASNPVIVLLVVVGGVLLARRWPLRQPRSWRRLLGTAGVGVFLVLLGCFPYACVKRTFDAATYSSNASQLIPIGGGFVLAALVGAVRMALPRDRHGIAAMVLLVYLLVSFCGIWWTNSLHWQARATKERAVAAKLTRDPAARNMAVFFFADTAPVPRTDQYYPPAITGVQVQEAFGGDRSRFAIAPPWVPGLAYPQRLAASSIRKIIEESTLVYQFEEVRTGGRQAYVSVNRGRARMSPEEWAWRDLGYRFAGKRGSAEYLAFLDSLAEVLVLPTM
jgi:type II secretory pathway component PulM